MWYLVHGLWLGGGLGKQYFLPWNSSVATPCGIRTRRKAKRRRRRERRRERKGKDWHIWGIGLSWHDASVCMVASTHHHWLSNKINYETLTPCLCSSNIESLPIAGTLQDPQLAPPAPAAQTVGCAQTLIPKGWDRTLLERFSSDANSWCVWPFISWAFNGHLSFMRFGNGSMISFFSGCSKWCYSTFEVCMSYPTGQTKSSDNGCLLFSASPSVTFEQLNFKF